MPILSGISWQCHKYCMRVLILFTVLLQGCVNVSHTEGELPRIEITGAETVCTKRLRVRSTNGSIVFVCERVL